MESTYLYRTENFWVSPFNARAQEKFKNTAPRKVQIHDATLRDGEQTPGLVFRKEDKIKIARKLDELGVDRIEAGMPVVSEDDYEAIKAISALGLKAKIFAFCRANPKDVEKAADAGVDGVGIEVPAGLPRLKYQFKWTEEEVIERALKGVTRAKELGLYVTFFPYETTRAERDFLQRLVTTVVNEGKPDSVAVIDTSGSALPWAVADLVQEVKAWSELPVEVHCHNDFGMAVASQLAAVNAGASVVHTCINGLGERTGNASLEQIILGLKVLMGYDLPVKTEKIKELSTLVEELAGYPVPRQQPVTGQYAFSREIGPGMDLLLTNPLAIFPLNPLYIGNSSRMIFGKKSGATSVEVKLKQLGLAAGGEQVREIVALIKEKALAKKDMLTEEELLAVINGVLK
ncbi:MAG: LeuA family protein [Peptococcaceae bacterium]